MKKILVIALAVMMLLALAAPVMADEGYTPPEGAILSINGVGFHCGCEFGGNKANDRVTVTGNPAYEDGDVYAVNGNSGANLWLVFLGTDNGKQQWGIAEGQGTFTCECGNDEWVSFSNQNAAFNGKSVQLRPAEAEEPIGMSAAVSIDVTGAFKNEIHKPIYKRIGSKDTVILLEGTSLTGGNKNNAHFGEVNLKDNPEGALALAVGNNKNPIGIVVNYKVVCGEVKLWFDGDLYSDLVTGGVIAIVSSSPIKDAEAMKPGHAKIGIGEENATKALKEYSPNGDMSHKNAIKWYTGSVDTTKDVYLFLHFAGVQANDLGDKIGCKFDGYDYTDEVDYEVVITDEFGAVAYRGGFDPAVVFQTPTEYAAGIYEYIYTVALFIDGEEFGSVEVTLIVVMAENEDGELYVDLFAEESNYFGIVDFGEIIVGIICGVCQ